MPPAKPCCFASRVLFILIKRPLVPTLRATANLLRELHGNAGVAEQHKLDDKFQYLSEGVLVQETIHANFQGFANDANVALPSQQNPSRGWQRHAQGPDLRKLLRSTDTDDEDVGHVLRVVRCNHVVQVFGAPDDDAIGRLYELMNAIPEEPPGKRQRDALRLT